MSTAKDIKVAPIAATDAAVCIKRHHYSGKVVQNSQLHLGVFLDDHLEGAMQFGPSLDKRKLQGLVEQTPWNGFIELNRLAFSDRLPRNSESRALAVALRLIRQHYPHIQWVVSFADAAQSGDGTIYRATGFVLTGIRRNTSIWTNQAGVSVSRTTVTKSHYITQTSGAASMRAYKAAGYRPVAGYQLRYLFFLSPTVRERLTVPILPFSKIADVGAGMYLGKPRVKQATDGHHPDSDGAAPIHTLQSSPRPDGTPFPDVQAD